MRLISVKLLTNGRYSPIGTDNHSENLKSIFMEAQLLDSSMLKVAGILNLLTLLIDIYV